MDNNKYVDIVMTGDEQLRYPSFTEKYIYDYCADLSKEDIDFSAIRDDMLKMYTIDGKLVSVPIMVKATGMAVNKTLLEKESLSVPKNYSEYPDDNYDGAILKFFEGNVPFWICDTEKFSGMKKRESKSEAFTASPFEYSFEYVPMGDNGVYEHSEAWSGFSINKNSDAYDYAVEFIRFLATEEQINLIASVKGMPSVANNTDDKRYSDIMNISNAEMSFTNDGTVLNHYKDYISSTVSKFGSGELKSAEEAVRHYIDECVKVAKKIEEEGR